jgi:hypothetical protein
MAGMALRNSLRASDKCNEQSRDNIWVCIPPGWHIPKLRKPFEFQE